VALPDVLPKTKAFGVLSGTIASLGICNLLLSASSFTVDSSHGFSPALRYCKFVELLTMTGPIRYWINMKITVPTKANSREKLRINIIDDRKIANMKATRKIDMVIVSFNSTNLLILGH